MRIGRHEVAITNPDKVFFPERGLTKGDLVAYYVDVADVRAPPHPPPALPHEALPERGRRATSSTRSACRRTRTSSASSSSSSRAATRRSSRSSTTPAALAWVVNLGCIELHTWHSRVDDIERPDYLLIDLDPSDGNPWAYVREIALVVQGGDGRARPRLVPEDLRRDRAAHPRADQAGAARSRRCAASRRRSPRRSSGASATRRSRRRRGGSPTGAASSSTSARTRATGRSRARTRCGRLPDARVSAPLAWDEVARCRPGGVHARDDARADRRRSAT